MNDIVNLDEQDYGYYIRIDRIKDLTEELEKLKAEISQLKEWIKMGAYSAK